MYNLFFSFMGFKKKVLFMWECVWVFVFLLKMVIFVSWLEFLDSIIFVIFCVSVKLEVKKIMV